MEYHAVEEKWVKFIINTELVLRCKVNEKKISEFTEYYHLCENCMYICSCMHWRMIYKIVIVLVAFVDDWIGVKVNLLVLLYLGNF